jgi:hypothetical protein
VINSDGEASDEQKMWVEMVKKRFPNELKTLTLTEAVHVPNPPQFRYNATVKLGSKEYKGTTPHALSNKKGAIRSAEYHLFEQLMELPPFSGMTLQNPFLYIFLQPLSKFLLVFFCFFLIQSLTLPAK